MPRLRMLAGPNGSGKSSTLKSVIPARLLGVDVNADDIEQKAVSNGFLDLAEYGLGEFAGNIRADVRGSSFLAAVNLSATVAGLKQSGSRLDFSSVQVNSYVASAVAAAIRFKLVDRAVPFTFETVMSSPDKLDFLKFARSNGFRTYLYYVALEDPLVNVDRVALRVASGGHPVPEEKILQRYSRSLDLLIEAISSVDRAYIFDNSGENQLWLAEVSDGVNYDIQVDTVPAWFQRAVLDKLEVE